METFVLSKRDSNENIYHSVIAAPDFFTACLLFAREMLDARDTTLESEGASSLASYVSEHSLEENWKANGGDSCPNCGSRHTVPMTNIQIAERGVSPVDHEGKARVCKTCAFSWIPLGMVPDEREKIEAESQKLIDTIDKYEEASLNGEEYGE